jgi:hypothetical protein
LSIRNPLTVAGSAKSGQPPSGGPLVDNCVLYVRSYVPPVTSKLVQQLSLPLPPGPQSVIPGPPGWQLDGPVVEPEEPLVEVDKPELLLEPAALKLAPFAPEPLVAEELPEPVALTPELIVELVAATLCPDAPASASVTSVSSSRPVLEPQPARTETAAVIARIRVWNSAALIPLPNTIP